MPPLDPNIWYHMQQLAKDRGRVHVQRIAHIILDNSCLLEHVQYASEAGVQSQFLAQGLV